VLTAATPLYSGFIPLRAPDVLAVLALAFALFVLMAETELRHPLRQLGRVDAGEQLPDGAAELLR
jgi:hypothetical protein